MPSKMTHSGRGKYTPDFARAVWQPKKIAKDLSEMEGRVRSYMLSADRQTHGTEAASTLWFVASWLEKAIKAVRKTGEEQ